MWTYKTTIVFPKPLSTIMNVSTYFILAAVLGFAMGNSCPPTEDITGHVQGCLAEMMKFIQAEQSQKQSACPSMKKGIDCMEDLIDSCKDNEALRGQYDSLKKRMTDSKQLFEGFCDPKGCGAASRLQKCASLVESEDRDTQPDCSVMKKGFDCFEEAAEACKDDQLFQTMFKTLKEQFDQSKEEYERRCGSAVATSSSFLLTLCACLLSLWFRK